MSDATSVPKLSNGERPGWTAIGEAPPPGNLRSDLPLGLAEQISGGAVVPGGTPMPS